MTRIGLKDSLGTRTPPCGSAQTSQHSSERDVLPPAQPPSSDLGPGSTQPATVIVYRQGSPSGGITARIFETV
jgi:hypothetical protein